jgi:hypothetical protein
MKLGIVYNVFDGHELLGPSIQSVRQSADQIIVVWQKKSNFGDLCHPHLKAYLQDLQERGLVDELILYEPRGFNPAEVERKE